MWCPFLSVHVCQERYPDLQAEQEARAAEYRAEQKAIKREQERLVRRRRRRRRRKVLHLIADVSGNW